MTAAHLGTLQSAACCFRRLCVHRDTSLLASQSRLHTARCGRSPLGSCGTMQAASALDSCGFSHPAELERHSSASYTINGAEAAGPLDMPPGLRLGPRVEHVKISRDGSILELLPEALDLPQDYVQRLIEFGAVYYCPIHPPPPQHAITDTPEGHQQAADVRAARLAGAARHDKDPNLSVPRRIAGNCPVHQHGYCRVHVHPKRFPLAYTADWQARIMVEEDDYVVLNKPPGVQVTPTVDNLLESCLMLGAKAIGREEPLLITHRLDTCTEGVLIMGKTKAFVQQFNAAMMRKAALQKTYRALTRAPLSPGVLVDYVYIRQRQKGSAACTVVLEQEEPDSLRCELEITAVEQVSLTGDAQARWGDLAFEHTIDLRTGRTHQIRVQLAAAGAPLLGDHLYGSSDGAPSDIPLKGDTPAGLQGKRDVIQPVGLQAYQLRVNHDSQLFGSENKSFTAPTPWWRV